MRKSIFLTLQRESHLDNALGSRLHVSLDQRSIFTGRGC